MAKVKRTLPTEVDPTIDSFQHIPLWCVYGHEAFPQVLACYVKDHGQWGICIWGYSVYKRKPGYRTLGIRLSEWIGKHDLVRFFDSQENAMEYLETLVTPRCQVPQPE